MNKVDVFNRKHAAELTPDGEVAFISISALVNRRKGLYDDWPVPMEGWWETLDLRFDDVIQGHGTDPQFQPYTPEMANQTGEFIDALNGRDVIVHCDAGISRSVAVGCFLRDFYGYEATFHEARNDNHRNITVYNELRRYYMMKHLGLQED